MTHFSRAVSKLRLITQTVEMDKGVESDEAALGPPLSPSVSMISAMKMEGFAQLELH